VPRFVRDSFGVLLADDDFARKLAQPVLALKMKRVLRRHRAENLKKLKCYNVTGCGTFRPL